MLRPLPSRRGSGSEALAMQIAAGAAAVGLIVAWGINAHWQSTERDTAVIFALFIGIGDLLEVPLLRRSVFTLGLAPALAYVLLNRATDLGEIATVGAVGVIAATLVRAALRREARLEPVSARFLVLLTAAATYHVVGGAPGGRWLFGPPRISALGLIAMLAVVIAVDVFLQSVLSSSKEPQSFPVLMRNNMHATWPLLLSSVSVAALLALSYPGLGWWTLPLFLGPLAATEYSFRQVATIRRNYLQTVRALSKVPEMAGYTLGGHSSRVAKLSVEIAKELRMGDPGLMEVEYAALLHDIGRVSLPDPEDQSVSTARLELALVGADIIEETGHFPRVARMVREQNEPYRRRGEDVNKHLDLGAKIIKVASAYDDLTVPAGPGRSAWDALERLHMGMAYEYDPAVIQALTRVLERGQLS